MSPVVEMELQMTWPKESSPLKSQEDEKNERVWDQRAESEN